MKRFSVSIWFILLFMSLAYAQNKVVFEVQAPRSVQPGERFEITYLLKNAAGKNFKVSRFKGCQVLSGPSYSQSAHIALSGGHISRIPCEGRTYLLQAGYKGSVIIPASSVSVEGKKYKSPRTIVEIQPDVASGRAADIQFTCSLPDKVHAGETFRVVYRISGGNGKNFTVGKFRNCRVISGPSIKSGITTLYFRQKPVTTYTYTVKAGANGPIVIPEARVRIENKKYKTGKIEKQLYPEKEAGRTKRFQDAARKYPTI